MKAVEVTGSIDSEGKLLLDAPIQATTGSRVRVIVLFQESVEEDDPDDTPIESVKASLRRALQQAQSEQRIPLSKMWEEIEPE